MEEKMKKILKKISEYYGYDLIIDKDGSVHFFDYEENYLGYKSVKSALKHWLITLKETDAEMIKNNEHSIWKEEIKFIKSI